LLLLMTGAAVLLFATPPLMPGVDAVTLLPPVVDNGVAPSVLAAVVEVVPLLAAVVVVPALTPLMPGVDAVTLLPPIAAAVEPREALLPVTVVPLPVDVAVPLPATAVEIAATSPAALPPLAIAGVGAELIDELTVTSGLAVRDGGMNWPLFAADCESGACVPEGETGPSSRPRNAWRAAIAAAASTLGSTPLLAMPGPLVVPLPLDEPGVALGAEPGAEVVPGWPLPGVRLVVQPKMAREDARVTASSGAAPLGLRDVGLTM
jgi:hypothetical protein